jgi:hypothetical protein
MNLAVKYRKDVSFQYPAAVRKDVTELPNGFDEILTQEQYDQLIADNSQAWADHKADLDSQVQLVQGADRFRKVREKWQDMADAFANLNVASGITTAQAKVLADGFSQVKYYLETNVPMQAVAEIDSIATDPNFLTVEKRDEMKAELVAFISQTFGIE